MVPVITGFERSPDRGRGLARAYKRAFAAPLAVFAASGQERA